jgi:hypothetical protein
MRAVIALLLGIAALVVAAPAAAQELTLRDDEGRAMRFDVRAPNVDVQWFAGLLRRAAHGDEIETVTIRIVDWPELRERCGGGAAGCYDRRGGRGLMVVPPDRTRNVAHTVVHEYGHHVDASNRHGGRREPNGTRHWWRVRGLDRLVELQSVARSYRIGWSRSIAEIFAEDYAYVNLGGPYKIGWLSPPDRVTRRAILADLGLAPPPPDGVAQPGGLRPLLIERRVVLTPGERSSEGFGLLGPDRRVTFTASLTGPGRTGSSARLTVECDGRRLGSRTIVTPTRSATIDLPGLGPARCTAGLANVGAGTESFRLRIRLAVRP